MGWVGGRTARRRVPIAMILLALVTEAACSGQPSAADDVAANVAANAALAPAAVGANADVPAELSTVRTQIAASGMVVTDVGCLPNSSAATLHAAFTKRIGPLMGWDNPHVYQLGGGRRLWLVQDAYIDYPGTANGLHDNGPQIQNLAFLQQGSCFTLMHRGTRTARLNFEPGVGAVPGHSFFWPLGGQLINGRLQIFWAKMIQSVPKPPPGDGLHRHPGSTWIATYDPVTLRRLSFRPAPNSGVFPQYGFAVASDHEYTYLFGNSNELNLHRQGGFYSGPHSATRMYLARVPLGQLGAVPRYRTATGWSRNARDAVSISTRYWAENTMQPRYIDGQWIAVTKEDGFWGDDIVIDVAKRPWGPWRTVQQFRYQTRYGNDIMNSYQPILLPWRERSGRLGVVISENARAFREAIANPLLYRPAVFTVPFPPKP